MSNNNNTFECCKQGTYHKGTPSGSVTKLGSLDAYVTGPSSSKLAILIVADVFGWTLNNTRVLADKYAAGTGARVYLPDFLGGEPLDADMLSNEEKRKNFDLMAYLGKHHPREAARPAVTEAVKEIRSAQPGAKIGAIGFCWGAPSVLYLSSSAAGAAKVDAIAFAHPSVTEVDDYKHITVPSLFLTCEHDQQLPDEKRNAAIEETKKITKENGVFIKWVYYPNATHGFAVRGDDENPYEAQVMQDAKNEAVAFFATQLQA